jgi:hypothetical protein
LCEERTWNGNGDWRCGIDYYFDLFTMKCIDIKDNCLKRI